MEGVDAESFALLTAWWDKRTESVPEYQSGDIRGHSRKGLERRSGQNDVAVICVVFCGGVSDTRYYGSSGKLEEPKFKTIRRDIRAKR